MSDSRPFQTWDVFTATRFAGNPLAIVDEADGLSTTQMLTLAREFNLSETIFVQTPDDPAHSAKVRIFFPTAEIAFAGHPTIGCAIWMATRSAPDGDFETGITLEEQAGLVPVRVWRIDGTVQAEFQAPVLPHVAETGAVPAIGDLAAALGLAEESLTGAAHAPGLWQGGPSFLYVPLRNSAALARAAPREPFWSRITEKAATGGVYLYAPGDGADYQARMFAPTDGIPEDPATGSASALLAGQLHHNGPLPEGETALTLLQGVEMGRPSRIGLTVTVAGQKVTQVRVRGSAVPVSAGRIALPGG